MRNRNLSGVKGGHNVRLIISQPSARRLSRKCEPWRLITLWASTACYRDSFTFTHINMITGGRFVCKDINVPASNIKSSNASSRRTNFAWRVEIEHKISLIYRAAALTSTVCRRDEQNLEPRYTWIKNIASLWCLLFCKVCNVKYSKA
jgi:hypothetical protein